LLVDGDDCDGRTGADAAVERIRRVISVAGSAADVRTTDSGGAASKTSMAAARAEGRRAGSAQRQEVRTSTSLVGVPGLKAPGLKAPGLKVFGDGHVEARPGGMPRRQSQPSAATE
jgi:hypothetical protein